jgi:5-methylcytosine-specific restriction endonuclease McrA
MMGRELARKYGYSWQKIAKRIKKKAGWKCVRCRQPHESVGDRLLTVHHLDGNTQNNESWNLAPLCAQCHLHLHIAISKHLGYRHERSQWMRPYHEARVRALKEMDER